jgi:hypothetical protein
MRLQTILFLPIRIHSWGGLGSQLNAINAALRLHKAFPKRKITLIFHTSGVTKRPLALNPAAIPFGVKVIDDFVSQKINSTGKASSFSTFVKHLRVVFRRVLVYINVVSILVDEQELLKLKWFCIEIRGHYSEIGFLSDEIARIWEILFGQVSQLSATGICSLHLRLGDLLMIVEKSPIDPIRIQHAIDSVFKDNQQMRLQVYSDSNSFEIENYLQGVKLPLNFEIIEDLPVLDVIRLSVASDVFIGTNSKISLWIAIFRMFLKPEMTTFIPNELKEMFNKNLPLRNF